MEWLGNIVSAVAGLFNRIWDAFKKSPTESVRDKKNEVTERQRHADKTGRPKWD
jgi:hypothetical protein